MNRYAAAPATLILVGIPIAVEPSWLVTVPALLTAILCAGGLVLRSLRLIMAGGMGAMIVLAAGLWRSSSSLGVVGALAFGLALLLLLDTVEFSRRFARAEVDSSALRLHVAWWMGRATIILAAGMILLAIASAMAPLLPLSGRPILAGAGALTAFAAGIMVAKPRKMKTPEISTREP
jgi:hypothetical protein